MGNKCFFLMLIVVSNLFLHDTNLLFFLFVLFVLLGHSIYYFLINKLKMYCISIVSQQLSQSARKSTNSIFKKNILKYNMVFTGMHKMT